MRLNIHYTGNEEFKNSPALPKAPPTITSFMETEEPADAMERYQKDSAITYNIIKQVRRHCFYPVFSHACHCLASAILFSVKYSLLFVTGLPVIKVTSLMEDHKFHNCLLSILLSACICSYMY